MSGHRVDTRSTFGREHEEALVRFIEPRHRARFKQILQKVAKGGARYAAGGGGRYSINHFPWWDERYVQDVRLLGQPEIDRRLRAIGAADSCWVISERAEFDGVEMPLGNALDLVMDPSCFEASVISCIPGRVAYYHDSDEESYLILERTGE